MIQPTEPEQDRPGEPPLRVPRFTGRNVFFLALFALAAYVSSWFGFAAFAIAPALAGMVGLAYVAFTDSNRRRGAVLAGLRPCPRCGSMQTDAMEEVAPDGSDRRFWRCFACSHDWPVG